MADVVIGHYGLSTAGRADRAGYDSSAAANFWDVFGRNTDYVIDPEETLADNFGYLFAYGFERDWQTPELLTAIETYLKNC